MPPKENPHPSAGTPHCPTTLMCTHLSWTSQTKAVIYYMAFCVWFLSLRMLFSRFIHGEAGIRTSFLLMVIYYLLVVWVQPIGITCSLMMGIWVVSTLRLFRSDRSCASFCGNVFSHIPSRITGSYGNSMFNFPWKCQLFSSCVVFIVANRVKYNFVSFM